jgi:serine/threonine protein kinase
MYGTGPYLLDQHWSGPLYSEHKQVQDPFTRLESKHKTHTAREPESTDSAEISVEQIQAVARRLNLPLKAKAHINSGAFGDIYTGIYAGKQVIIKVETLKKTQFLHREYEMYVRLNSKAEDNTYYLGIPRCYFFGSSRKMGTNFNLIVVHRMGPNLEQLWNTCGRQLSVETTCLIALQCLDHLEYIHKNGIVHRDLKPANFVTAYTRDIFSRSALYILDFGLAEYYMKDGKLLPDVARVGRTGTGSYMSKFTMRRGSPSPRDDIQSLRYMLVLLVKGALPWTGVTAETNDARKDIIAHMKETTTHEMLCDDLPPCFYWLLHYSDSLKYGEFPKYRYLKDLFRKYFRSQQKWINYSQMDWNQRDWKKPKFK